MNISEAEKIVNAFRVIVHKTETLAARPISLLTHSKGKIKYAFFILVENLAKNKQLTQERVNELTSLYARLDPFVDDKKAEEINRIGELVKRRALNATDPKQHALQAQFNEFFTGTTLGFRAWQEIADFMDECFFENGQKSLIYQEKSDSGTETKKSFYGANKLLKNESAGGVQKTSKKFKILFFEDDRLLRNMYETKFSLEGFLVAGYDSPTKDPVSIILKEKPDIIISGVIMPLMDGFGAARIYKADPRTKDIPLIFLTNLGMEENVKEANALGAVYYMVKAHFMPSEVVNRVRQVLGLPIPPEKPIPPPGEAWHGPSVADQPSDKSKSWWQKLFG